MKKKIDGIKISKKALAGVMAAALAGSTIAGCGSVAADTAAEVGNTSAEEVQETVAESDEALLDAMNVNSNASNEEQGKEETVYLFADSEGNVTSTIVSGWLKNPQKDKTLVDVTDIGDVVNVKGDETFEQNGNEYTWKADGKDIYYQGTSQKDAPVSEKITYYLNGEEIAAKDLAGKSGQVKIRFDYENNQTQTAVINGKEEEIRVPFAVVTGMILNDRFKNISVENGRLISDGKSNIVVGFALPGLKESLNLDDLKDDEEIAAEDISIPEYVEVSADVENFEMEMTLTVATSSADLSFDDALDFSDLDEKIDTLSDSSLQLVDGTTELTDGITTLKDSLGEFSDGVATLKDGIVEYTDGAAKLGDGINQVKDGAVDLDDGAGQLANGLSELNDGAGTLIDGVNSLDNGAGQLKNGIQTAKTGAGTLAEKINVDLKSGVAQLFAGSKTVADGVAVLGSTVQSTMQQVMAMKSQLIESEVEVVKGVYSAAGMSDAAAAINASNVSAYAAGIADIKEKAETQLSNAVSGALQQTAQTVAQKVGEQAKAEAEKAAMEAAQQAGKQGYESGYKEGYEQAMKDAAENPSIPGGAEAGDASNENNQTENTQTDAGQTQGGQADNSQENGGVFEEGTGQDNGGSQDNGNIAGNGSAQDSGSTEKQNGQENAGAGSGEGQDSGENADNANNTVNTGDVSDTGSNAGGDNESSQGGESVPGELSDAGEETDFALFAEESDVAADEFEGSGQQGGSISVDTSEMEAKLYAGMEKLVLIGKAQGAVESIETILGKLDQSGASMSQADIAKLQSQVEQLVQGAYAVSDGLATLNKNVGELGSGASELASGMNQLESGSSELKAGTEQLKNGSSELIDGVGQLVDGSSELKAGTQKLVDGAGELQSGAKELTDNSGKLVDGAEELADGTGKVVDGVDELHEGAGKLLDGMAEFNEEGIQKIADAYNTDVKELTDRVKAVTDAGSTYDNFSGKAENMKSSVKFIIRTEAVK